MEALAHSLANRISMQMEYDEDKKAVLAYGLTAIIQMLTIFVIISIIGILGDFWIESIIIFLGVGFIRKSTGGAHSRTMYGCIIISVLSITTLSTLSRYVLQLLTDKSLNSGISIMIYIFCLIIFYIRVPVESPNKPIRKPEKIKRLRRQSFFIITIFFLLSLIFIFNGYRNIRYYSISASIQMTMLWQLLTLTKIGALFFGKIDLLFMSLNHKRK